MLWSKVIFFTLSLCVIAVVSVCWQWRKKSRNTAKTVKQEPTINADLSYDLSADVEIPQDDIEEEFVVRVSQKTNAEKRVLLDPETIVIQAHARKGKPYMGYELLQALLSSGLRFGDMNIFHRYENFGGKGAVLFSLAAATKNGTFEINNMGGFACAGLVFFMRLNQSKKLMSSFDLMLDTARQLIDDLGGELYDEANQPLNTTIIRGLRERICEIDGSNQYSSDLLDNLIT